MTEPQTIRIVARDGEYVGQLTHVLAPRDAERPNALVVERNGDQLVLPLSEVERSDGDCVRLNGSVARYQELPPFERQGYRVLDEEIAREDHERRLAELGIDEDFQIGDEEDEPAAVTPPA
ncbi:MAG: hypothetical protein IT304_03315 [Dehalococcoidia bacterium]|nr:hypothetical protein [Dehalococcoidia bacterium]